MALNSDTQLGWCTGAMTLHSYNGDMRSPRIAGALLVAAVAVLPAAADQTPQPFPRPGSPQPPQSPPSQPQPPPAAAPVAAAPTDPNAPTASSLGFPIYPTAQFITSYDAGKGQRYYLFGSTSSFAEIVAYYRAQLDERGDLVFKEPPTHMFEVGRFRDETMAFPPGVTVKDWTWGGSAGYPNPRPGAEPARFATIVMIVPPPAPAAAAPR
jgi:hypothetical protein